MPTLLVVDDEPAIQHAFRRAFATGGDLKLKEAVSAAEAVAQVQREPAPDPFVEEWRAIASQHLSEGHPEH